MQQIFTLGKRGGVDTSPLLRFFNFFSVMIENKIEEILLEKFQEEEFQDCMLIEISMTSRNTIEVILDADEGLTLEKCQRISRHVENWLDTEGVSGGLINNDYTLEVSSPGVSRPLMYPRQYTKHIGRTLELTLKPVVIAEQETPSEEPVKLEGKLQAVDNQAVTIEYEEVRKEGKKKIKENIMKIIPFETIHKALVKISFK